MKPKIDHIHVTVADIKRSEVDAVFARVSAIPAVIVHPPRCYEKYCTDYYAFFFKDSEGIEYEIVNFARTKYFH